MTKQADTALSLMKKALAIPDEAGDGGSSTACLLQTAIDAADGPKPMQEGDEPRDETDR